MASAGLLSAAQHKVCEPTCDAVQDQENRGVLREALAGFLALEPVQAKLASIWCGHHCTLVPCLDRKVPQGDCIRHPIA